MPRVRVETIDPLFWLPVETRRHLNQMQREGLLAMRSSPPCDSTRTRMPSRPWCPGGTASGSKPWPSSCTATVTRRTRENFAGADLNRDYKSLASAEVRAHVAWLRLQPRFDLVLCLHEDWEAKGFYLYELNLDGGDSLAPAILAAVSAHSPIEHAAVIDGRPSAAPGIIRPVSDPLLRDTWPEALYLAYKHCGLNYTFETASAQPLAQRVSTHCAAVRAALQTFLR